MHNTRTKEIRFDIVDTEYSYNAIISEGNLNAFEAIVHPAYLCMKNTNQSWPNLRRLLEELKKLGSFKGYTQY
jgi:hypothetical protein